MKIPSDAIGQTLLKPLDADLAAAALETRIGLDRVSTPATLGDVEANAGHPRAAPRDSGELVLGDDVWNGSGGSRLLPMAEGAMAFSGTSSALDQTVDAILTGLH